MAARQSRPIRLLQSPVTVYDNEASEPAQTTYGWSKEQDDDGNSVERVRIVNYAEQPEPEDVELTLHRGLQARQVRTYPHSKLSIDPSNRSP
jgi:hypothetical protein